MRLKILSFVSAAVVCLSVTAEMGEAAEYAYVALDGENRIAVYAVDEKSGELSPRPSIETPSPPGGLTSDPGNRFLFASLRQAGRLASFRIGDDGRLILINTVEAGADPAYVATDRTGRFLLTAYYVAAKVSVHRIGKDGSLSEKPIQEISTDEKAHAVLTDPTNQFAFVPHTGPNAIYQFRFDEKTGHLSPNDPLILGTGENSGPRQLACHPKLDVVFFDYEQGSAIAAFDLNRKSGRLSFRERLSSIPADFSKTNSNATNSNARIEIHPTGRFVYVANRGHDSLAGYRVNSKTGQLTSLGQTPTEKTPRGFTITPSGRFLYAAGESSDRLAAFRINQKTGELARFATYDVGKKPWWVHVVALP
jgi:6-phosphogluconolactonase